MVDLHYLVDEGGLGDHAGVGREQPRRIGQQQEQLGPDQVGHQRGQPIVVPEADLLVGHGIVLIDHRDHPQLNQVIERAAGMEILRAVDEVQRSQQHLAGQNAVRIEPVLPRAHQAVLADGRHGLQHGGVARAFLAPTQCGPPGRDGARRHDDHRVAGGTELGDLAAQAVDGLGRDRRRTHLDHDRAGRRRRSRVAPR